MKETFERLVDHLLEKGFLLEEAIGLLEKTLVERALQRTRGNRSAAAKLLGIHRNTLQRKLEEYKIAPVRVRRKPPASVGRSARRKAL
jgi:DNA-binding NtrC family response regulator